MILNPSRTYTTLWQTTQFSETPSEIALHKNTHKYNVQRRRGTKYTWVNQSLKFRSTKPNPIPTPFLTEIVEAVIPGTLVGPKVTFTGMEDPEAHLAAFHTQMMLVGGSDAARCKLFMSTLAGTAMEWFMSLLDGQVTSFPQLTKLFRAQYLANRAPPPVSLL